MTPIFQYNLEKTIVFFLHIILPCVVGRVKFLCVTTIYSCQAIIFLIAVCITHKDWSVFRQIDLNFCFTKIETSCCQLEMK